MTRLRARWLFPGDRPPVPHALLTIEQGRIVSVEAGLPASANGRDEIDLGPVAIVPGLINSHTHLEFSDLTAPVEPRAHFADWIDAVIRCRRENQHEPSAAIQQGVDESRESGTVAVAEIATSDWIFQHPPLACAPRLFLFREILGLSPDRVSAQLDAAESFLNQAAAHGISDVGLSPHAPYSLHPRLFHSLIELAIRHDVPVAMHLAESPAELELLRSGTGPLVDLFIRMGIWQPEVLPLRSRPLDYLRELARAPRGLVVHGNLLDEEELRYLASTPQLSVVYCPRTHQAMQRTPHPWRRMLDMGINVTLGTDSRASNPDLSLWNELRLLHSLSPDLPASGLLKLATVNAACALGWNGLGRLAPGFSAEFCVIPLSAEGVESPEEHLFESSPQRSFLPGVIAGERMGEGRP